MKFIRIKAVISAVIIFAIISITAVFFAGPLIKLILKSQLESMNGAEVNIENVSLGLSPLAVTVDQLQFTDSENPGNNLAEIKQLDLQIKTDSLLKAKFVVRNMSVEGLRFNTIRKTPGDVFVTEVEEKPEQVSVEEELSLNSIDLPDIDNLMDKAGLQTGEVFDQLEQKIEDTKKSWNSIDEFINDKAKWDGYKKRYKQIKADYKKGNTKKKLLALKALKDLHKEIKKELKTFSTQRKQLKADYSELQRAYKEAKLAPSKDIEKIKSNFSFNEKGLGNISQILFGDDVSAYLLLANKYYKKIAPYLESDPEQEVVIEREQGRYVQFEDYHPEPVFLIEKATITAQLPSGDFVGSARDIAFDQVTQNKPSIISLSAKNLKHSEAEEISLKLDARDRKHTIVQFNYDINKRQLGMFEISKSKSLPLKMDSAILDMNTEIKLVNSKLSGYAKVNFSDTHFVSARDTKSRNMASMLTGAFENVKAFDVDAKAAGKITSPKLKIKSDLDKRLNKQLKRQFNRIKKEYEAELKEKFNQRYAAQISKVEKIMKEIENKKRELESKQQQLSQQLSKYKK